MFIVVIIKFISGVHKQASSSSSHTFYTDIDCQQQMLLNNANIMHSYVPHKKKYDDDRLVHNDDVTNLFSSNGWMIEHKKTKA